MQPDLQAMFAELYAVVVRHSVAHRSARDEVAVL